MEQLRRGHCDRRPLASESRAGSPCPALCAAAAAKARAAHTRKKHSLKNDSIIGPNRAARKLSSSSIIPPLALYGRRGPSLLWGDCRGPWPPRGGLYSMPTPVRQNGSPEFFFLASFFLRRQGPVPGPAHHQAPGPLRGPRRVSSIAVAQRRTTPHITHFIIFKQPGPLSRAARFSPK